MNTKSKQLLIAIVVFLGTLFFSNAYIEGVRNESVPKEQYEVAIAVRNITAGERLTVDKVSWETVPSNFAPHSSIKNKNDLQNFIGQETIVDIPGGDYILQSYFPDKAAISNKLSGLITEKNMRAINIPVDESNSMARSILPNDRIDIIFTYQIPGLSQKMSTVLLQNVQVLSTGSYSAAERERGTGDDGARRYNSITMLLSSQDSIRLAYARQVGQIGVMLRGAGDIEGQNLASISGVEDILSPEDKDRMNAYVAKRAAQTTNAALGDEKVREQLKQIFEQRRQQGGAGAAQK